ncbi:MAG: Chromosome partition protein Smc [Chlamydiae bacterium]|nr:Chromosome partition protein Smc [Chlamydiota bacterium]
MRNEAVLESSTYTEEEFKKILKTLFAEKKRVKELQKQLQQKGVQKKFQTHLSDIQKLSYPDEIAHLNTSFLEKEKEVKTLRKQLEKVRPALRKLIDDLKEAREYIHDLESGKEAAKSQTWEESLAEYAATQKEQIETLEELKGLVRETNSQSARLAKRLDREGLCEERSFEKQEEEYQLQLEKGYKQMRLLSGKHACLLEEVSFLRSELSDRDVELRKSQKSQNHLAKKSKGATSLRELADEQGETLARWEEKYASLEQKWEGVREEHEAMKTHFSQVRHILEKTANKDNDCRD